jgi:secreted trypsin-like serine protease
MTVISHFMFRLSAAELVILAGVLNNTLESTEDTKVVREVTDVFVHEEYDEDTLTNDIAILKVRIFRHRMHIFCILLHRRHTGDELQCEI